jgi:hypothetical protein
MAMSGDWERVSSEKQPGENYIKTYRMLVPGGWLVRTTEQCISRYAVSVTSSMIFFPDPDRLWVIN